MLDLTVKPEEHPGQGFGRQDVTRSSDQVVEVQNAVRLLGVAVCRQEPLCEAMQRARSGRIDANLCGGVIKQRIAREGGGRSGGFRTIVLFRRRALAFFVYGFAKSDRENLRRDELATYRLLADEYLSLDAAGIEVARATGAIIEVICDDQAIQE